MVGGRLLEVEGLLLVEGRLIVLGDLGLVFDIREEFVHSDCAYTLGYI